MEMYIGLHIAHKMSIEQRLTLRQSLELLLKQELRQELKLAIKQLLTLFQKLEQCLRHGLELTLTDHQLHAFVDTASKVTFAEWTFVNDRVSQMRNAGVIASVFRIIGGWDNRCATLAAIGHALHREEHERSAHHGPRIALRILLRNPKWFGGVSGSSYNLWSLLNAVPQLNSLDAAETIPNKRWILAGGWAVELLTSVHLRPHHDIDTLILSHTPLRLDTDVVIPTDYFKVLSCTGSFISTKCTTAVEWTYRKKRKTVYVTKPEFLFASKFLRPPRPQDWNDVKLLIRRFCHEWDLDLIRKLCRRQACGFTRTAELMQILSSRQAAPIIDALADFYEYLSLQRAS